MNRSRLQGDQLGWDLFRKNLRLPGSKEGPMKDLEGPRKELEGPMKDLEGPRNDLKGPRRTLRFQEGPRGSQGPSKSRRIRAGYQKVKSKLTARLCHLESSDRRIRIHCKEGRKSAKDLRGCFQALANREGSKGSDEVPASSEASSGSRRF